MVELVIERWVDPLIRWWWLILIAPLLAGSGVTLIKVTQPQLYRAHIIVTVSPKAMTVENPEVTTLEVAAQLAAMYVDLAQRRVIQEPTRAALQLAFLPEIAVWHSGHVIDVVVMDTNRNRATAVANELVHQLKIYAPQSQSVLDQEQSFVQQLDADYKQRIAMMKTDMIVMQGQIDRVDDALLKGQLLLSLQEATERLQDTQTKYNLFLTYTESGGINVIRQEEFNTYPVQLNEFKMELLAAIGFSLVMAVMASYLFAYFDNTVQTGGEVTALTGLTPLALISRVRGRQKLITVTEPRAPISESIRGLRSAYRQLMYETHRSLLITSPMQNEGKSFIAANLAVVMAQQGFKTLLIDANLRRPSLHEWFHVSNKNGLSQLLSRYAPVLKKAVSYSIQGSSVAKLSILPGGPPLTYAPDDVLATMMPAILEVVQAEFEIVIIDSPAMLAVADATILSNVVDDVMVVLRSGQNQDVHIRDMAHKLQLVNANLIGIVLNQVSQRHGAYYYYYGENKTRSNHHYGSKRDVD